MLGQDRTGLRGLQYLGGLLVVSRSALRVLCVGVLPQPERYLILQTVDSDTPLGYTGPTMSLMERIRTEAYALGFSLVGVSPPHPPPTHLQAYHDWLDRSDHGEMGYLSRPDRVARREDPAIILPAVRSVLCVATNYYPGPLTTKRPLLSGRISNYAWGQDYHDWMLPRLERLAAFIQSQLVDELEYRAYVDTGPLLERSFAEQAGLGFVGKNTCLIHPKFGSWLFLGELLLSEDIAPDREAQPSRCGKCTRCLEACPTGALVAPYRLDARRCVSYLTIELKGSIPRELRPGIGDHIYGCDICQLVCPWQRFSKLTEEPVFQGPSGERAVPPLVDLLGLEEDGFQRLFSGSPILRLGRAGLLRNAAVALGNVGDPTAVPALVSSLGDEAPLVRGHVAWALGRIGGLAAIDALKTSLEAESDVGVRQELIVALEETVSC